MEGLRRPRSVLLLILGLIAGSSLLTLHVSPSAKEYASDKISLPKIFKKPLSSIPHYTPSLFSPSLHSTPIDSSTESTSPDPRISQTRYLGGVPGHQVFQNIWIKDKTIYVVNPRRKTMPGMSRVVSGETEWVVIRDPEEGMMKGAEKALVLEGSTIFINDGAKTDTWHYLSSYYPFIAEVFLGSIAALASVPAPRKMVEEVRPGIDVPSIPTRLIIPWKAADGWRDDEGMNELVLRGVLGNINVMEPLEWHLVNADSAKTHDGWIFFERAVIADRWASHRHNPLSDSLNKMAASIFSRPHPPFFFTPVRLALLSHLEIPLPPNRIDPQRALGRLPKIVYVDRQNTDRKLSKQGHQELSVVLGEMEALGKAVVGHKKMGKLNGREKVESVHDADILIGVHGDGITNQLWMPEGGIVIELFPKDSWLPEHQIVSDVLNHEYIPIWNDQALSREEWDKLPRQHGEHLLSNGEDIPLDGTFLRLLLEEIVQRVVSP
ncbi:uncharacterized protein IL334_002700 [Kwoniella shivajii]|uniref:Glycosyltransferase 61 catalytic domain-containing protein n=1 Tax=Kwoniella shivajii TaxID=564305 RepID=A0ABZ1CVG8_9TREE|nr:hypothetical protein IL334_002700 [Kwoniella shivajii]